jgi:hypothetical protein
MNYLKLTVPWVASIQFNVLNLKYGALGLNRDRFGKADLLCIILCAFTAKISTD